MNTLKTRQVQQGGSLIVGLLLMLVASIVTVASMRGSHLQEKMASNTNNKTVSFMAAQAGATEFLAWVKKEAEDGETFAATKAKWEADTAQPTSKATAKVLKEGGSGQYWFSNVVFDDTKTPPEIRADVAGVSQSGETSLGQSGVFLALGFTEKKSSTPPTDPDPTETIDFAGKAPAALSCFGGACNLSTGAGGGGGAAGSTDKAGIDGRDHKKVCTTPTSCTYKPLFDEKAKASVYFSDKAESEAERQGGSGGSGGGKVGKDKEPKLSSGDECVSDDPELAKYQGKSRLDGTRGCGADSIWSDDDYSADNKPDVDIFFGSSEDSLISIINSEKVKNGKNYYYNQFPPKKDEVAPSVIYIDSKNTIKTGEIPSVVSGILVIDGNHFTFSGNTQIYGFIVIINCGKIQFNGGVDIYGAVVVNARKKDGTPCGPSYSAFEAKGTPKIGYSTEALGDALKALNPGGGGSGGSGTPGTPGTVTVKVWREL